MGLDKSFGAVAVIFSTTSNNLCNTSLSRSWVIKLPTTSLSFCINPLSAGSLSPRRTSGSSSHILSRTLATGSRLNSKKSMKNVSLKNRAENNVTTLMQISRNISRFLYDDVDERLKKSSLAARQILSRYSWRGSFRAKRHN